MHVHLSQPVMCHISYVTCHMSLVTCHMLEAQLKKKKVVEPIGGGSVIKRASSSSFYYYYILFVNLIMINVKAYMKEDRNELK